MRDSINSINNGQSKHLIEFRKSRLLTHSKPKIRNAILTNCENDLIHIICNCVYNVAEGNVPGLTQEKVNKLVPHKTSLTKLTEKVPIKEKRKIPLSERWWISFICTQPCCSLDS